MNAAAEGLGGCAGDLLGHDAWRGASGLPHTLPNEAESGGGLQVATTQLAITIGAAVGGLLFNLTGAVGVYVGSSVITLGTALVAFRNSAPTR